MAILRKTSGWAVSYTHTDLLIAAVKQSECRAGLPSLSALEAMRFNEAVSGNTSEVFVVPCDSLMDAQEIEYDVYGEDADFEPLDIRGEPADDRLQ